MINDQQLYIINDQQPDDLWLFFINLIIIVMIIYFHQTWCSLYDQWSTINNETGLSMESCVFSPLQYVIMYHAGYSPSWIFIIIVHSIFQLHQSWCSLYDQWSTQYIDNETRFAMENFGFPLEFVMTLYSDLLLFFITSFIQSSILSNLDALCMINDQQKTMKPS